MYFMYWQTNKYINFDNNESPTLKTLTFRLWAQHASRIVEVLPTEIHWKQKESSSSRSSSIGNPFCIVKLINSNRFINLQCFSVFGVLVLFSIYSVSLRLMLNHTHHMSDKWANLIVSCEIRFSHFIVLCRVIRIFVFFISFHLSFGRICWIQFNVLATFK